MDSNSARDLLREKRREILERLARRDPIEVEKSADQVDDTWRAGQREIAAIQMGIAAALLRQIDATLERIEAGRFGICEGCEENIGAARLASVPWAALCRKCQEVEEAAHC